MGLCLSLQTWFKVGNCECYYTVHFFKTNSNLRAKYPLAIVEVLLEGLGADISGGYDIGCKFGTTLDHSPLGDLAQTLRYKALVGSFHGHVHNCLCQLSYLATYVKGMGLEDLEGCERFFSKSNALASSLCYASVFHRQQNIVKFMQHMDTFETYQNLSRFPLLPQHLLLIFPFRWISCQ